MHVIKHAGNGDVLLIGVEIWPGPCVVGEGVAVGFVGRPRDPHHVHVDVELQFLVLGQTVVAIVRCEGIGPAQPFFFT